MLPILHQVMGSVLVLLGIIVLPMPIPFGLIMMVIGLALLAPYFVPIQKVVRHLRRKHHHLDEKLRAWHHRFPPVIQKTIDKTHP